MIGAGGAIAGVGAGLSAIGSKEQASHQQLQAAISATGHDYEEYGKKIEGAIKHQENFGNSANETQDALRILTSATNDPAKALQFWNTTADLAAAKHISLSDAATKVGKAYNGNTRILKEFGIQVAKAAKRDGGRREGVEGRGDCRQEPRERETTTRRPRNDRRLEKETFRIGRAHAAGTRRKKSAPPRSSPPTPIGNSRPRTTPRRRPPGNRTPRSRSSARS